MDPAKLGKALCGILEVIESVGPSHEDFGVSEIVGDLGFDIVGVQRYAEAFETLGIPFYAAIGNHDYLSPTDRRSYEETFKGQTNYIIEHGGWQLVGIDTTEGNAWQDTKISSDTLAWLDESLPKLDRRKPTILFTHFPMGANVPMRPLNADDVLARLLEFNLGAVFCGHFHGYTERDFGNALITTDRCCARVRGNHDGSKEKGWFVCRAEASGDVTREFIAFQPTA